MLSKTMMAQNRSLIGLKSTGALILILSGITAAVALFGGSPQVVAILAVLAAAFSLGQLIMFWRMAKIESDMSSVLIRGVDAISDCNFLFSQSTEYARNSLNLAKKVKDKTVTARTIISKMGSTMESMQRANGQLQKIADVIGEISARTNVINDIVFKTQLLSFNASIEAARAGQQGKGFAVVAEEVGTLAQTSGDAAKEIHNLLEGSKKEVAKILKDSDDSMAEGQQVSDQAKKVFTQISSTVETILKEIDRVTSSFGEQERKISQGLVILGGSESKRVESSAVLDDESHGDDHDQTNEANEGRVVSIKNDKDDSTFLAS